MKTKLYEMYNLTEYFAVDEVIVSYKLRASFRRYIPKKHRKCGIKFFEFCYSVGYTYDMSVYLGKKWQNATSQFTETRKGVASYSKS